MILALIRVFEFWKQHALRDSRLLLVLIKDHTLYLMMSVLAISLPTNNDHTDAY